VANCCVQQEDAENRLVKIVKATPAIFNTALELLDPGPGCQTQHRNARLPLLHTPMQLAMPLFPVAWQAELKKPLSARVQDQTARRQAKLSYSNAADRERPHTPPAAIDLPQRPPMTSPPGVRIEGP
jgi:hypothetical protein